jgi:hypothetical protein
LELRADYEQPIGGQDDSVDFPTRLVTGADYLLADDTTLFAEHELTGGEPTDSQTTRVGMRTAPWKGAEAFASAGHSTTEDATDTVGNAGIMQKWMITDEWSGDAGLERTEVYGDGETGKINGAEDSTAVSLGATYNPGEWIWNARAEQRHAEGDKHSNLRTSLQTERGTDLGLIAAFEQLNHTGRDGSKHEKSDLKLGLAYRPDQSRWIVLDRLELIKEWKRDITANFSNWRVVNNLAVNYQATDRWQLAGQYGAKIVQEKIDGIFYGSFTDLMGFETRYDITDKWDLGLRASVLHAWGIDQMDYSSGVSIGHSPANNIWISLGYNFFGFTDEDFSRQDYTSKGIYLQFRMKFDQESIREVTKWANQ